MGENGVRAPPPPKKKIPPQIISKNYFFSISISPKNKKDDLKIVQPFCPPQHLKENNISSQIQIEQNGGKSKKTM